MLKKLWQQYLKNKTIFWLIVLGSITWSLTMVKSGIVYSYGMGFWGPNGHDGVWHIAVARAIANGSWGMPIFAGEVIKNYHIGFDLILAALHKLTFIPIHTLYFQILPSIMAILVGLFCYNFIHSWTKDKAKAFWGTFFVYFGGGLGWIVSYLRNGEIAGESVFWSQQSISTLINPPFALSLVIVFAGLYYLINGVEKKDKRMLAIATFLFGILVQIKVYAGILMFAGLLVAGIWNLLKRKGSTIIKVFTGSLVISILIFSPTVGSIGNTLVYKPFWFLETMMNFPDRLGWQRFGEAMVNYKLGGVWIKVVISYFMAFIIFLVGNLGTRLVAIYWFFKKGAIKKYQYIDVLVVTVILLGIITPMFFVQAGTAWNTIQFMYYSLDFTGILAGISFVDFVRKLKYSRFQNQLIEVVLLIFTLPIAFGVLYYHYLPSRPPAKIGKYELEALEFLEKQPEGVVLTQPFDKDKADAAINYPPRPLYLYESTAYVSAFSGKVTYLADQVNLDITGYDWILRRGLVEEFFAEGNFQKASDFLKNSNIEYLYILRGLKKPDYNLLQSLDKIFENDEIEIYQVI